MVAEKVSEWPALRKMRQRWAQMLKRIFEVEALRCERCGGEMRIVAFIVEPEAIGAILRHLRRAGGHARGWTRCAERTERRVPP